MRHKLCQRLDLWAEEALQIALRLLEHSDFCLVRALLGPPARRLETPVLTMIVKRQAER